jgi:hypothetical protein
VFEDVLGGPGCPMLGRHLAGFGEMGDAALRTGTTGSQDESRCSAIHKFHGKFKFNSYACLPTSLPHSQEWLCHA